MQVIILRSIEESITKKVTFMCESHQELGDDSQYKYSFTFADNLNLSTLLFVPTLSYMTGRFDGKYDLDFIGRELYNEDSSDYLLRDMERIMELD